MMILLMKTDIDKNDDEADRLWWREGWWGWCFEGTLMIKTLVIFSVDVSALMTLEKTLTDYTGEDINPWVELQQ